VRFTFSAEEQQEIDQLVERLAPRNFDGLAEPMTHLNAETADEIDRLGRGLVRRFAEIAYGFAFTLCEETERSDSHDGIKPDTYGTWNYAVEAVQGAVTAIEPLCPEYKQLDALVHRVWGEADGTPAEVAINGLTGTLSEVVFDSLLRKEPNA
jgi:hypothetical protein